MHTFPSTVLKPPVIPSTETALQETPSIEELQKEVAYLKEDRQNGLILYFGFKIMAICAISPAGSFFDLMTVPAIVTVFTSFFLARAWVDKKHNRN